MRLLGINNKSARRIRRRISMLKSLQNKLNTYRTNEINTCETYNIFIIFAPDRRTKNKWNKLSREMKGKYVYIHGKAIKM